MVRVLHAPCAALATATIPTKACKRIRARMPVSHPLSCRRQPLADMPNAAATGCNLSLSAFRHRHYLRKQKLWLTDIV